MIRLQINPRYADLLRQHGIDRYDAIMHTTAGEIIEENAQRDIRRLQLDDRAVYLKRTRSEKTSSAFETYLRGHLAHSKPFREMLHFQQLEKHGFDVAEVVAVGEELRLGIPRRGFIITAEVRGPDLAEVYRKAGKKERRRILGQFGALLGHLHDQGFYGSTRLKDIIYAQNPGDDPHLVLIDREVRNPYPKRVNAARGLSRLLLNVRRQLQQGEIFRNRDWREFSRRYCESLTGKSKLGGKALFKKIKPMRKRYKKSRERIS